MRIILQTPRLSIRRFTEDDVVHFRPGADGDITNIDLGCRLPRSTWNKGCATEGSRALIDTDDMDIIDGADHGVVERAPTKREWQARTADAAASSWSLLLG